MNVEEFRNYCIAKQGVTDRFPFDENTLVFFVMNKMFALTGLANENFTVNLKCDPQRAVDLREEHIGIKPGFHMNKKHWNTLEMDVIEDDNLIMELINHSYDLVVRGLRKIDREALALL